ncbi:SWIM zinc finger family protein [Alkalibacterium sp. f15]|uniref:SWIM zinc finger family protein n=1 Tax=Alkalibacterium sp. f15 TaxID=3414029 RepID=UPI003BF89EB3
MQLSTFHNEIDPIIVERGLDYFRRNKIRKVLKKNESYFEFEVAGSKTYTAVVRLKEDKDTLSETTCTCPYDAGPYCKHQVAAFYYLNENKIQTDDGIFFANIRLNLSRLYKNELIEMLIDLAEKYPAERKYLLSKYALFRLYPDLRYLKMTFVETIVSVLGKGPVIDPYYIMDLTDDLAQIIDIAEEIEDAEVYFNIMFFFYTEVVMLKKMTNDTLGSLDALLMYILYDLKQRLSQTTMMSHTLKLKIIVSLDLTLSNDLFVQHMSESVKLISAFKDHMEEEEVRKRFISLLHKRMTICIQSGDEGNYADLLELKSYVEKWYGG